MKRSAWTQADIDRARAAGREMAQWLSEQDPLPDLLPVAAKAIEESSQCAPWVTPTRARDAAMAATQALIDLFRERRLYDARGEDQDQP